MHFRKPEITEPYRMLLIGMATLAVLVAGKAWPAFSPVLWTVFGASIVALVYMDLRNPVNYESISISSGAIEYVAFGHKSVVLLKDVLNVSFVREQAMFPDLDGLYIESKWLVQRADGSAVEIMDEWPHRKLLLQTFREQLPNFNEGAAREGLQAKGEGQWLCYQAAGSRLGA